MATVKPKFGKITIYMGNPDSNKNNLTLAEPFKLREPLANQVFQTHEYTQQQGTKESLS